MPQTARPTLALLLLALLAATPLSAQGGGRIIGRVVDGAQGAPLAGAQVEVVDAAIHAVSALDGRYTLSGVSAGPVSIRVRMIGFAPKVVTGVVVAAGQTVVQDVSMVAEAVQLAEISVNAEAERGTVNRALEEQPMVSSYHTDFGRYAQAYGMPWLRQAVTKYLRRFHARSRRVYTPSAVTRSELLGLGLEHVEVWGRGVDTNVFHPGRRSQELREALGMGSRFTFVYMGRLAAEKRVDVVLEGFRQALTQLPRGVIHLVLAGTGPYEAQLRAAAPPEVSFLGFLDRGTELPDLYANCDAFVFASVTETLGLVVLEAMASGLPVIAAPEGGVRDHLRDGVNGLTYTAGDPAALARAMVLLVSEWELTRRLARHARKTAEGLSWDRELDRLDASYREVCAAGAGGGSRRSVGKHAGDRRPATPLALGVHPSAVRLDEMLHDGEA